MTTQENEQKTEDRQESDKDRRRRVFVWLSEFGLVAVCSVVFLSFLLGLIRVYFPQGSELVGEKGAEWLSGFGDVDDIELGVESDATELFAGKIINMQRRVQRRRARSLAWNAAELGDTFVQDDAVQTFSRSTALLEIGDSSFLTVGENSLIVFARQEDDPFLGSQKSVLIMVDGELSGTLSGNGESRLRFGVRLPNSDLTLVSENSDSDIEFRITVNDDQSTTLNLHGGNATIVGSDGQRTTILAHQSVTIDPTGTSFRVNNLPPAPAPISPSNHSVVAYRNIPRNIRFDWTTVGQADRYHIVVACDPAFSDLLVDDDIVGTTFTHGALKAGTYYWHVRSRAAWSQSTKSDIRELRVVQDLDAPLLQLDPPGDFVAAGAWRLSGQTEADALVYVDGVAITHKAGRIDQEISLRRGANIITVKAMDDVGNLNYASLVINAK